MKNVNLLWFLRDIIVNNYKILMILEDVFHKIQHELTSKLSFQQCFLKFLIF